MGPCASPTPRERQPAPADLKRPPRFPAAPRHALNPRQLHPRPWPLPAGPLFRGPATPVPPRVLMPALGCTRGGWCRLPRQLRIHHPGCRRPFCLARVARRPSAIATRLGSDPKPHAVNNADPTRA